MQANAAKMDFSSSITRPRIKFMLPLGTAVTAFLVYLFTVERDLTWQSYGGDGGELITASYTLGIPHPPGYPTYVMLGKIFSLIPFGTVAGRYNLFSSLALAIATGFVALTALQLISPEGIRANTSIKLAVASAACGLTLAFFPLVWSQANVAEVYALNLAVLAIFLWALISERSPALVGCLLGLAITAHLTSLLIVPLSLLTVPRRSWPRLALGLFIGLLPFLFIFKLASGNSPVVWGTADSLSGWWWLISARLYHPNSLALPMDQWVNRLLLWGPTTLWPMITLSLLLLIARCKEQPTPPMRILALLLGTSGAYAIYAFLYATGDAIVLLLPSFLLLSICLIFVIRHLAMLSLTIPLTLMLLSLFVWPNSTGQQVRAIVGQELQQIPENALVITPGNQSIASLWYFQHVEGWRPDLIVVDGNMFQFDWYRDRLEKQYPDLVYLEYDDLSEFSSQNLLNRPVCHLSLVNPTENACRLSGESSG